MRANYPAIAEWCSQSGYELRDWIRSLSSVAHSLECSPSLRQLPEFLGALVSLEAEESLIWIRDWTIWNDRSQEIGLRQLAMLVGAESIGNADDDRAVAFVLEPDEWREAIALLTVPMPARRRPSGRVGEEVTIARYTSSTLASHPRHSSWSV